MEELLKAGRKVMYSKGEIFIRPSDFGRDIFVLISGMAKVYTIDKSGAKNTLTLYGPGEVFPIVWIVQKEPLNVFFEAVDDCELVRVPAADSLAILSSDARSSFTVLEQVIRQFVLYAARVDNLEYKFARERVAYHLLMLGNRFGSRQDGRINSPRFSHEEIGAATNVSRESVSREMKRFEKLGFIKYSAHGLVILSEDGLHKELAPVESPLFIDDL